MGAFNTVSGQTKCPKCSNTVEVLAQFKFGSVWQHKYHIGDLLEWGRNDRGKSGLKHVVVDAVIESACPRCGFAKEWDLYLHIEHDRLVRLQEVNGEYEFVHSQQNFIIVER